MDLRTKSKVEAETTHIRTKAQTDRGRNLSSSFIAVVFSFFGGFLSRIFFNNTQSFVFRASYASEHVNGGKFEESKKNAVREGKGGQPPSGGGNKKRLKSKKLVTGKHSNDDNMAGQQQFQFQNNAHLSIHGHLPNGGAAQRMNGAQGTFPMVKGDNNHSQANNNNNNR